jgi:hypothetical protein
MKNHKKVLSFQILIEVQVKVIKPHFEVDTEVCTMDIINMKINLMEVKEKTLEEKEVMEVVVEIIKVNNQIMTQTTTTTMKNLGTWQIIIIKGNMMHEMESCNKGIIKQLIIKAMKLFVM